jgi:hypothetical protein
VIDKKLDLYPTRLEEMKILLAAAAQETGKLTRFIYRIENGNCQRGSEITSMKNLLKGNQFGIIRERFN